MKQTAHHWTPSQIAALVELYPHVPTDWIAQAMGIAIKKVYAKAHHIGLEKTEAFLNSELAGRIRPGSDIGADGRFRKGHTTWNKGMKGLDIGGKATRFQPGIRHGRALKLYQPIGSERISKDGYRERKINDDMPFQKRWRAVHILIWEAANGPLPPGHAIAFKDGDKTNIDPNNLECITRGELMRRNTYHNYPKEIGRVIQLRGAITRQINQHSRKESK